MPEDRHATISDPAENREDTLRFLIEAGELLASSLDFRQALASIAVLLVPRLADFVVIDLVQPDGSVATGHALHLLPEKQALLDRWTRVDLPGPPAPATRTGEVVPSTDPLFAPTPHDLDDLALDPARLRLIRELDTRSLIVAPMAARGHVLGAITAGRSEDDAPYTRVHLEMIGKLARRGAVALEHALLYASARQASEEAESARSTLQRLVASSNHVIVEYDAEGRYLSITPAEAPRVYRKAEMLLGRTVHEVLPPETADRFLGWITQALREQRGVEIEYALEIDRREVWFAGSVSPLGDDRVVWVVRDITKRKRAEEALAQSERRFRATFEQAAVGISHIDQAGRFLRVNQRLADLVGYPREELLRLTFQDITHPADRATHVLQAERLLTGEVDSYTIEKRYLRKTGEPVWVSVTGSLVRTDAGEPDYFISVVQDVDERRALEEQLIRAQKMEAVGRLAGGVAHEFNNALTTITGFSDLILATLPSGDPLRPDVEEISRAAWRAAGVANRLMVFSSSDVTQPEVLDLGAVVAGAERMLAQLLGEDVELQVDLGGDPSPVHADRRQLEQVVVNLAVNARDAMPAGGRLRITTSLHALGGEAARRLGVVPGDFVVLTVEDTGEGMSAEVQARIFDPFFTTKPAGKGTGLGLSIVYGIVRHSGGTLEVDSTPGRGTTFRIYLPRSPAAERGVVASGELPGPARRGGRVMLVEDDPGVRTLGERVMRRLGYDVMIAASAEDALRLLTEDPRPLDLLVTDLVMPGMSGRELARALETLQPGLRVLFTSGYSSDRTLRRRVEEERRPLLGKPFSPAELEQALREVLGD